MGIVKTAFKAKADTVAAEIKELLKEHGNKKIGEVTLSQVFQGMRGITGLVTDPTGAAISAAQVLITNTATNSVERVTSTSAGEFTAPCQASCPLV